MNKIEAQAFANAVCRAMDYYVMAQRVYVEAPTSSDESIAKAKKAEAALAEALEQLPVEE